MLKIFRTNLFLYCMTFGIFIIAGCSGEYYVSPNGRASWANARNRFTPTNVETAMLNAQPGDIILFLNGTYQAPAGGSYIDAAIYPRNSGTSNGPIILRSLNLHGAILTKNPDGGGIIGTRKNTVRSNYIWVDGFDIRGCAVMTYTTGSKVINNKFTIGGNKGLGTTFGNMVFMEEGVGCYIGNNLFSDNIPQQNGVPPGSPAHLNDAPIMIYFDRATIIEKNTFINLAEGEYENKCGIYLKDAPGYGNSPTIIRYNFLYDAAMVGPFHNLRSLSDVGAYVYQNVLSGARAFHTYKGNYNYWQYYNNTHYNTEFGQLTFGNQFSGGAHVTEVFNNILHASPSGANYKSYDNENFMEQVTIYNWNRYIGRKYWDIRTDDPISLTDWQLVVGNPDLDGSDEDAFFVNPGGTSPYDYMIEDGPLTGGRGGSYSEVVGAFITGDEQIGHSWDNLVHRD